MTKFVVLRPMKRKTAEEVVNQLLDIFCLLGPPYILQSDNGREFKNVDLAKMIRELWPGCKIVHENRATLSHKVQWKKLIKKSKSTLAR